MIETCARNNVDWHDAIFRAHGLRGTTVDGLWLSRAAAPPYYANAVTVSGFPVDRQMAWLRDLGSVLSPPWSVKDSFSALDLSPLGFRRLFDAEWIWREPGVPRPRATGHVAWRRVSTPDELERWETAWRENGSPAGTPVFLPGLLQDDSVAMLAGYDGTVLVAGCVANRSDDAVGFSNFFALDGDDLLAADAVGAVARFGGGLPVVGYEAGDALARALRLGFHSAGALRVWMTAVDPDADR